MKNWVQGGKKPDYGGAQLAMDRRINTDNIDLKNRSILPVSFFINVIDPSVHTQTLIVLIHWSNL
jgi:hypothetical protein